MRLPNGYGSVYKLSGKRRKPWVARKTVGYKEIPEKLTAYPIYNIIGYYATRQEALSSLVAYNENPFDLDASKLTFEELYDKWSDTHFEKVSNSAIQGYKAAYTLCDSIKDMKINDIKLAHLQNIVDKSGKNQPTLKKLKVMLGLTYDYAVKHEIITPDKRELIRYLDIDNAGNPNALDRKPFSTTEISTLWAMVDSNEYMQIPLILIYTGLRLGEFRELKTVDVHLEERWLFVRDSKTESGIRQVPIAEKLVPFFQHWLNKNTEFMFSNSDGKQLTDKTFRDTYWSFIMDELGMTHLPHDTRHTCVSLLTTASVDSRVIKKIVGHKGQGVTEIVYTHLELPIKLEAINKI